MNWKLLIAEIQERGDLTQTEIAEKCGTAQSTISSLIRRDGGEPNFSLGEKLKDLHKRVSKRKQKATA
jgi:transcriptional regulator with XRE-family HTH domain